MLCPVQPPPAGRAFQGREPLEGKARGSLSREVFEYKNAKFGYGEGITWAGAEHGQDLWHLLEV